MPDGQSFDSQNVMLIQKQTAIWGSHEMPKQRMSLKSFLNITTSAWILLAASPAFAQETSDEVSADDNAEINSADQGEAIIVTGTRLRGVAPVGSALIGVDRSTIEKSTAVSTTQLLQELPQVFDLGISENSRGQSGGAFNTTLGTSINIRGIGPFSTLTLIDSHRSVPQGVMGFAVDPSIIPTIAIERLEIVADGASAIYGSDAVAGVANIILRRNYDGLTVNGRYGLGDNYDEYQYGLIAGKSWGSGNITASVERQVRNNLRGIHRDFFRADLTADGGNDYRAATCDPGNIIVDGTSYAIPEGGVTQATAGLLLAGTQNRCDYLKVADLAPRQERISGVVTFNQDITDWLRITGDAIISKREFEQLKASEVNSLTVPSTNAFFVDPTGTNRPSTIVQYNFLDDYGPQLNFGSAETQQFTIGFEADLGGDWQLTGANTRGWNQEAAFNDLRLNSAALRAALASSDPATALDPYGLHRTTQATLDRINNSPYTSQGETRFVDYQVQVNGPLFSLPGGDVKIAAGYEYQFLRIRPLSWTGSRETLGVLTKTRTRTANSAFAELYIPVVGAANAMPGIERLELNVAGRYDKYDDVGDTWNPKIGVNYSPVDGLRFHASYGTSFRAPTLSQLYGTGATVLSLFPQPYFDPTCDCVITGVAATGENTDLVPEEATTYSFGLAWEPAFADGLRLSVNYFDIYYTNQIQAYISDLSVLGREDQFEGTGIIVRNPDRDWLEEFNSRTDTPRVLPNPAPLYVDGRSVNSGDTVAKGFDFQVSYNLRTDNAGDFAFSWNGSYFTTYKTSVANGGQQIDVLNTIYFPLRFKSRASVDWTSGRLGLGATVNYINSYQNNVVTPTERVSPYTLVDARLSYELGDLVGMDRLQLGLDARNLLDKDPSYVNVAQSINGGGGYDVTVANPIGRVISLSLTAGF